MIYIEVIGTPESKGSLNAFLPRKHCDIPVKYLGNNQNGPFYQMKDGSKRVYRADLEKLPMPVVHQSKKTNDWEKQVKERALDVWDTERIPLILGPVKMMLRFNMRRPKNHYRTGKFAGQLKPGAPLFHISKPDGDKLTRCILDALTGVCYKDDSQVTLPAPLKVYTDSVPSVEILIGEALEVDLDVFNTTWFLESEK